MSQTQKAPYNQKSNAQVISLEKGKLPPQAIDIEEAIIGACMIEKFAISEAAEIIGGEKVFYKEAHQLIYDAMSEMFQENEKIDLLTVAQKLKTKGHLDSAGGEFSLVQLTQKVSSSAHIERHCRIVMQMHVKREAIRIANEILENAYQDETDIFELLAESQRKVDSVAQWLIRKKPVEFKNTVDEIFSEKERREGMPSKISIIQKETNGFSEPDLIILAGRPGMGKTAYMLNEAKNLAMAGIPVGIFSLEMSAIQLTGRMLAEYCGIDSKVIKNRKWNDFERRLMEEKRPEFEKLPIYIHDQASTSSMELKIQAGKWKREKGVRMIFVDYLQLMTASGKNNSGNREQEISYISRTLKATAKDLQMPIMALSQLSRAVETRGGSKRPILSDLRESGAIEQDADIVIFVYRPEYYKIDEWDDDERFPTHNEAELIFAKHRGGELFAVRVKSELQYMRFEDLIEPFERNLPPMDLPDPKDAFDPPKPQKSDDDLPF